MKKKVIFLFFFLSFCQSQQKYESWSTFCQKPHSLKTFQQNLKKSDPDQIKILNHYITKRSCGKNFFKSMNEIQKKIRKKEGLETTEKIVLNLGFLHNHQQARDCFDELIGNQRVDSKGFFQLSFLDPEFLFEKLDQMIQSVLKNNQEKNWMRLKNLTGDPLLWIGYANFLKEKKNADDQIQRFLLYSLQLSFAEKESLRPSLSALSQYQPHPFLNTLKQKKGKGEQFYVISLFQENKHPDVVNALLDYSETHPEFVIRTRARNILDDILK